MSCFIILFFLCSELFEPNIQIARVDGAERSDTQHLQILRLSGFDETAFAL
jgi:hypothetical protein